MLTRLRFLKMFFLLFGFCLVLSISCRQLSVSADFGQENTSEYLAAATVWMQTSAEARALYYQTFELACLKLEKHVQNYYGAKPSAVVLDLDETVLDNTPYEAMLYRDNIDYPELWDEWISSASAKALPGVTDFLRFADSLQVDIFYITNRKEKTREATLKNLQQLGFPDAVNEHLLLRTTDNDKTPRRDMVSETHEILLLLGDNLGDFDHIFQEKSVNERAQVVDNQKNMFGERYIILPNPAYGDWIAAVYDYDYSISAKKKRSMRIKALEAFRAQR